jgi:P27 family predicted phage terminase small subunit
MVQMVRIAPLAESGGGGRYTKVYSRIGRSAQQVALSERRLAIAPEKICYAETISLQFAMRLEATMPGPTPTHLKLLRGNPIRRPILSEPEPKRPPECPPPPDYLHGYAIDEWCNVGPQLYQLGLLTVLDVATLAAYCVAYGRWRAAVEALQASSHGLLIETERGKQPNPMIGIALNAAADALKIAGEFGLTSATRSRLAASLGGRSGDGKFEGLLG